MLLLIPLVGQRFQACAAGSFTLGILLARDSTETRFAGYGEHFPHSIEPKGQDQETSPGMAFAAHAQLASQCCPPKTAKKSRSDAAPLALQVCPGVSRHEKHPTFQKKRQKDKIYRKIRRCLRWFTWWCSGHVSFDGWTPSVVLSAFVAWRWSQFRWSCPCRSLALVQWPLLFHWYLVWWPCGRRRHYLGRSGMPKTCWTLEETEGPRLDPGVFRGSRSWWSLVRDAVAENGAGPRQHNHRLGSFHGRPTLSLSNSAHLDQRTGKCELHTAWLRRAFAHCRDAWCRVMRRPTASPSSRPTPAKQEWCMQHSFAPGCCLWRW